MNRIYENYINSRGINRTSAIGKYAQAQATAMDNYIGQKQEIQDNYFIDKENRNQIEDIAEQIAKEFEKIQNKLK